MSPVSCPTRLTTATYTPLAMAWARWMVRQASCCDCAELGFLRGMPADGGGIEQDLGALQRGQARAFRIPLVPADQRAHAADVGVESAEAEVAGSEVDTSRSTADRRGCASCDRGRAGSRRRRRWRPCCDRRRARASRTATRSARSAAAWPAAASRFVTGPGMGSARSNRVRVFALAEILGLEKFGQADDVGAARRGLVDLVDGVLQILCRGRTWWTSVPVRH